MPTISIDLSRQTRADLVASLRRYASENLPEPLGDLPATLLLDFILEEVGPAIYNRAIVDAQTRLQQRVVDLSGELYAPELPHWPRVDAKRKGRR